MTDELAVYSNWLLRMAAANKLPLPTLVFLRFTPHERQG